MNSNQIDPCLAGIRPHACIRHIPQWPDNSPRMEALRHEMQRTGFCAPVLMTAKHEVVDPDSRERWRAARALQLECIPVQIIDESQADTVFFHALLQRRHLTKSALAFLAYPRIAFAHEEARAHALKMIKKTNDLPSDINVGRAPKTVDELAGSLGISPSLLKEARRVHEIFAKDAAFKAQMEPRLLAEPIGGEHEQHRPVGLGAIIAGYAGKANEDKARADRSQLELFGAAVKVFCIRAPLAVHEAEARRVIAAHLETLSPEELENVQRTAALVVSEAKNMKKDAAK
ncbi:MAG: hypothetical protein HC901_01155 [Bdellovibrionaceae bacterium]|nr:hypothetical protein [Pseudobdellovibrionaceae bacterium]